jgi:hypothetical protein
MPRRVSGVAAERSLTNEIIGVRLIIPIVSIALAGAVWLLEIEHEQNLEQVQQIAKLKAEVVDKSVQQSIDLKRQCAADADRYFKKWKGAQTPSTA